MPAFSENDIKQYKTAHTVGAVTSLGGAITATEVADDTLHAMFDIVTESQAENGITEFRIVAFKNVNTTEDMLNPRALVINDSSSPNTTYAVGWMPDPISNSVSTLASETTSPVGVVWCESARLQDAALLGANIPRNNGYAMLALRRTVKPGAQQYKNDRAQIVILCDNLDVGVPIPTGSPTPPVIDVGVIGEIDLNPIWSKILEFFKYRNMFALFTCGNNIGGTVREPATYANDWLSMFGEVLRKVTWPCFGQRDRRPVVRNSLRTHFGLAKTYYTKQIYNAHFTVIDTSDPELVPYGADSAQFEDLKDKLIKARDNPSIDWRIVMVNRACFGATTVPSAKKYLDDTIRDVWAPMFEENFVHVVCQGTFANSQIAHVLEYNPSSPSEPIPKLTEQAPNYSFTGKGFDKGVMYIISGSGGFPYDVISNTPSYIRYAQSVKYGGFRLRINNSGANKMLEGDFIDDKDKIVSDGHFTITKL
jgi:hypothetical protein